MDNLNKASKIFLWAKMNKETGRIVGFLSKDRKRWLPMVSAGQKLILDSAGVASLKLYYSKKYGNKKNHLFTYREFLCGS
ncbi:MAG: hypothetical protein JST58_15780 [Bacteroidetes bacterium]|nr:hypothetical protein [Bacteroidota bacterium]